MKKLLVLGAVAFVMTAPPAFSAEKNDGAPHHKGGGMLEKIDANQDGVVSKEEFMTFHQTRFNEIDKDHDGNITKAESDAQRAEWKAKMKEMRAKRAAEKAKAAPGDEGKKAAPTEAPSEKPAEKPAQ